MNIEPPSELEVRAMRDAVFGMNPDRNASDKNWDACRDNWMRPDDTQWLREQWEVIKAKRST